MARPQAARMRRIEPEDLVRGAPLPHAVYDHAGQILVREGHVLTDEVFRGLIERRWTGLFVPVEERPTGEENPRPRPEELLYALYRRDRTHARSRARRHRRRAWRTALTVVLEESGGPSPTHRRLSVETRDLSSRGFAFLCQGAVNVGTAVFARFDTLPHRPILKGVVRNCTHVAGRQHRVGVEFVPLEPGDSLPEL